MSLDLGPDRLLKIWPKAAVPASQNAFEMVRALMSILKVFLTENGALPISKRIRNGSSTMVNLKSFPYGKRCSPDL
ncbi:MAG: hypothetical protein WCY94_05625, partial [Synergistaceae bacterium]